MTTMTPDKQTTYAVTVFTLAALVSALAVPGRYIRWAAVAILLLIAATVLTFVKKRSILSYHKRTILFIVLVSAIFYLVLYYASGIYFTFGSTLMRLDLTQLIEYIIPITAIILLSEYVRAVMLGQKSKLVKVIIYFACIITDVIIAGGVQGIDTSYKFADLVGMTLFPAITANLLFTYVSSRYGMWPNVVYRLITTLYAYIIPFIPNAPEILIAFALMMLPLILLALIDATYEKKLRRAREKKSKLRFIIPSIIVVLMVCFVMLVSCKFRYGILVIGSPSMSDEIKKGDAVVFESYDAKEGVETGDIIVFSKDGKTRFVHRIIEVNTVDGQKQYITKGDANEDPDLGFVTDSQVIGIVRFKVLYIGYPSLWMHAQFK